MRVLFVAPFYPLPIVSGGHRRLANLVWQASKKHDVHWISLVEPGGEHPEETFEGLAAPAELLTARANRSVSEKIKDAMHPVNWMRTVSRLSGRMKGIPIEVLRMNFPALARRIRSMTARYRFDVVQLEYTAMGGYLPLIKRCSPRSRVVLEEIDVSYIAMERLAATDPVLVDQGFRREVERMKGYERQLWRRCDAVVTMSDLERRLVAVYAGNDRAWSVPNGVDPAYFSYRKPPLDGSRILFLGNLEHPPNRVGLTLFLERVWPKLSQMQPGVELAVVGEGASAALLEHEGRRSVRFYGYVPDVRPLMKESTLMVAPIFSGSGTRLKILEAFATGLPVVSTPLGCEGIEAVSGREFLAAESADEFAVVALRLLQNPALRVDLAMKARELVDRHYSWDQVGLAMERVWEGRTG